MLHILDLLRNGARTQHSRIAVDLDNCYWPIIGGGGCCAESSLPRHYIQHELQCSACTHCLRPREEAPDISLYREFLKIG